MRHAWDRNMFWSGHLNTASGAFVRAHRANHPYLSNEFCAACTRVECRAGEPGALYVEEADGSAVALVTSIEQLDSIMAGLNRKGLRERGLLAALRRKHAQISSALDPESTCLELRAVSRWRLF